MLSLQKMVRFTIFSQPKKVYRQMLKDIKKAKKYIFLETYIYAQDSIGAAFRKALTNKAKQGVQVRLLLDAWGADAKKKYFEDFIKAGGEVKYFREFMYVLNIFNKNHERDHRKLLLIDDQISYIGSLNITSSCLNWRELVIRIEGSLSKTLRESFNHHWQISSHFIKKKMQKLIHSSFEILQDHPRPSHRHTEKKYIELIKQAENRICVVTPYFVPSIRIRKAFAKAAKKGVKIEIILPYISDVRIADIVRNRYLGGLYKKGLEFYYYKPKTLHAKLLIVDNDFFILGSSNLDYRSFVHQYEINLLGRDKKIISALQNYFEEMLAKTISFNYYEWKDRSSLSKIIEKIIGKFAKYL